MPVITSEVNLDPRSLVAQARRIAAADDDDPVRFTDGLTVLTTALAAEARLTTVGLARARASLVAALTTQFRVRQRFAEGPVDGAPARPVFITGLLRTGTTFLQHLLAQHPRLRSPALWELMAPATPGPVEPLISSCADYVADYQRRAPGFDVIHPLDARTPEECHRLTAASFRHPIYALRYRIPSYLSWLNRQSMTPAYAFHRAQLRCLLARRPGGVVVLKCPSHLWYLDALARIYPDARIIRLHRSPAVCLPSVCSLTAVVRSASSHAIDHEEIGRHWLDQADQVLPTLRPGVAPTATPPLDLTFAELVADPIRTADAVCDSIGVPLTSQARTRMSAFLAAQPRAGTHRYQCEQFGFTQRQLETRFADYITEFRL